MSIAIALTTSKPKSKIADRKLESSRHPHQVFHSETAWKNSAIFKLSAVAEAECNTVIDLKLEHDAA
ncbi:hypothetical protein [Pseudomonas putida]